MRDVRLNRPEFLRKAINAYIGGNFQEAERLCISILAIDRDFVDARHLLAIAQAMQGRNNLALDNYDRVLAANPDCAEALNNRGNALQRLGRFDEALESYERALAVRADYAEALNNRGITLHDLGRFEEALGSYDRALTVRADYAEALNNRGITFHDLKRFDEALASYERALTVRADYAEALNNRGITFHDLKRFDEALASYERALTVRADYAEALNSRGNILRDLGRLHEALESYERALAVKADYAEALNNRGITLDDLRRFEEALASYERALAVKADYAEALNNRGGTLQQLGRFDEAMASYEKALAIRPDYAECQVNRAFLLLLTGRFVEGWQGYEWRRKADSWTARSLSAPEWNGSNPAAKRLLFYSEQGLGDTIQFSRFACSVAMRAGTVLLAVQPRLKGLLSSLERVNVIGVEEPPPEHDACLPLMSLPHVLGVRKPVPGNIPYLSAEQERVGAWAKRLPIGGFRVGIVWQGKPTADVDNGRSIPLRCFAPLCRITGVKLISLQKYHGVEQLADLPPGMKVETLGEDFDSGPDAFFDAAAVMMSLDLVISSDTAAAHLAGALGCPVWIVLKHVPDWRWMMDREETTWYPTARLFRQTLRDDWDEVFERIASELARAVADSRSAANIGRRGRSCAR